MALFHLSCSTGSFHFRCLFGEIHFYVYGCCLVSLCDMKLVMSKYVNFLLHRPCISPQCLNAFTSNMVHRFLRGLYVYLLALNFLPQSKYTQFIVKVHYLSEVLRYFVMVLTVTSIFNNLGKTSSVC